MNTKVTKFITANVIRDTKIIFWKHYIKHRLTYPESKQMRYFTLPIEMYIELMHL